MVGNAFRFYDVLINRPDLVLIEGLVVDTISGGLAFATILPRSCPKI